MKVSRGAGYSRFFDPAPGHQKKPFLINRLEMWKQKAARQKGRFFVFLMQSLTFASGIDCAAVARERLPLRTRAV